MARWESVSVNVGETIMAGAARGHHLFGDVPPDLGGHDCAMIPPEGLLVVLGNCLGMVIALTCKARGVPYRGMTLEVSAEVNDDEHYLDDFRVRITMPEALDDKARRAIAIGESICKTAHTLQRACKVTVEVAE